jgi:hypothetical protein
MKISFGIAGAIGLVVASMALAQPSSNSRGVPIVYLEACPVGATPLAANADAQGRLAVYQLTVNPSGEPALLVRTADPANLVRFVQIGPV